ncbi:MAG: 1-acyl-sn-glycerol-3-phosphate acyltransferase, partial [Candidatus Thermoplasmatota archaeon]|nr:1-acyl-sn-glycerol-3-phosphate acyltransferase [Candidatus Thermoplasmatota archaeon]
MADVFERLAEYTGLSGTDEERSPPLFYRILMRVFPPMVRSLTNVRYEGLHNLPKNGAVILAGNHTSHIDPIAVIMGARKPI